MAGTRQEVLNFVEVNKKIKLVFWTFLCLYREQELMNTFFFLFFSLRMKRRLFFKNAE